MKISKKNYKIKKSHHKKKDTSKKIKRVKNTKKSYKKMKGSAIGDKYILQVEKKNNSTYHISIEKKLSSPTSTASLPTSTASLPISTASLPTSTASSPTSTASSPTDQTAFKNAKLIRGIYNKGYEFPEWVINKDKWKDFKFDETKVYYNEEDDLQNVQLMVKQREPVNIAMYKFYNSKELQKHFGYMVGAYSKSTLTELMPNIAIYCHATVKNPDKSKEEYVNAHVINLVGYAFDDEKQPDYIYFTNKYTNKTNGTIDSEGFKKELIKRYRKMWMFACHAAKDKGLKYLCLYNVGGGAFTTLLTLIEVKIENFKDKIFKPSFCSDINSPFKFCQDNSITILHQNLEDEGWFIPNLLFDNSLKNKPGSMTPNPASLDNTLFVNAWDPWSLIGNGNSMDNSLDGYWGRSSNMSVLGWTFTNKTLEDEGSYKNVP